MNEENMQKAGQEIIDLCQKYKLSRFETVAVLEGIKIAMIETDIKRELKK